MNSSIEILRYPIGRWKTPDEYSTNDIESWIFDISELPNRVFQLTNSITSDQLAAKYRPDSWNICQVIHHLADSHMNGYIRQKLAWTQETVTINPYPEAKWTELEDVKQLPIEVSLTLLHALHLRWTVFLKSLDFDQLEKSYFHPQHNRSINLKESIGMYAWHSNHHLGHIKNALKNPF